ncbi:hypothetical protein TKK_0017944 [Trichogramma kaykai]
MEMVRLLLTNGAPLSKRRRQGGIDASARHLSKKTRGKLGGEVLGALQGAGAEGVESATRQEARHAAASGPQVRRYSGAVQFNADPNVLNDEGMTPLHCICDVERNDDLMGEFLGAAKRMNKKVNLDVEDDYGRTPLQWAVAYLLPRSCLPALFSSTAPTCPNSSFPPRVISPPSWNGTWQGGLDRE